jgi:hypothetical protein
MNLKECFKIAEACGLTTVGEAFDNVRIHAINIFVYDEITEELQELVDEIDSLKLKRKDLIEDVKNIDRGEEDGYN